MGVIIEGVLQPILVGLLCFLIRGKNMKLTGLEKYQFSINEASKLDSEFKLVMPNVNFEAINLKFPRLVELTEKPGVYLWLMRIGSSTYKVYAGKTKSLPRRLADYKKGFQIHAPNDFKLQFFYTFILSHYANAEFDLYFVGNVDHTEKENEVLQKFHPLIINERDRVSKEDRDEIKNAFSKYYSSSFNAKLTESVDIPARILHTKASQTELHERTVTTNHDMMSSAMKGYSGRTLKSHEIKRILLDAFPRFVEGSFRPNDHGEGNKNCCACAGTESRIFDRVGKATYLVR